MQNVVDIIHNFALALLIALVVVGVPYLMFLLMTARARQEAAVRVTMSQIAATVRQNVPLATGLAVAAQSEPTRARKRLNGISRLIAQGLKLSDAMRSAFPECPGLLVSLVDAGERSGQLPAAVGQAETYLRNATRLRQSRFGSPLPYALLIVGAVMAVSVMYLTVLVPKFVEILTDFGVDRSQWILGGPAVSGSLVAAISTSFAFLLFLAPTAVWLRLRPRQTPRPSLVSRVSDWLRWHTPGLRRMEFGQGMSTACNAIEFCVKSGMNLHEAAATASRLDINWQLRQKFDLFSKELFQGVDARQAAQSVGIGGVAGIVFAAGERRGSLPAGLRFAADYYAGMMSRWWILISNLVWPVCTLLLASLVALLIYSMFQPLLLLLDTVITSTGF